MLLFNSTYYQFWALSSDNTRFSLYYRSYVCYYVLTN